MMDKYERRLRLLEQILVLGTLLVVFLGFALPSYSSLAENSTQPISLAQQIAELHFELVVTLGIFFILMAFMSYSILLFREEIVRSPKFAVAIYLFCAALMAILLGGLIVVGIVSGIVIKSTDPRVVNATIVGLIALLFAIFFFILKLLYLNDSDFNPRQPAPVAPKETTSLGFDERLEVEMREHLLRYVKKYDSLSPEEKGGLDLLEYKITTRDGSKNLIVDRNLLADYLSLKVAESNNSIQRWVVVFSPWLRCFLQHLTSLEFWA
jgi:hypothetical protein